MRVHRPRIRSLMIAVAVVAVILAAGLVARRRAAYSVLAEQHEAEGDLLEATASLGADRADSVRRLADHHRRLGDKYRRAASRPWRPIPPDPSPPE